MQHYSKYTVISITYKIAQISYMSTTPSSRAKRIEGERIQLLRYDEVEALAQLGEDLHAHPSVETDPRVLS